MAFYASINTLIIEEYQIVPSAHMSFLSFSASLYYYFVYPFEFEIAVVNVSYENVSLDS